MFYISLQTYIPEQFFYDMLDELPTRRLSDSRNSLDAIFLTKIY